MRCSRTRICRCWPPAASRAPSRWDAWMACSAGCPGLTPGRPWQQAGQAALAAPKCRLPACRLCPTALVARGGALCRRQHWRDRAAQPGAPERRQVAGCMHGQRNLMWAAEAQGGAECHAAAGRSAAGPRLFRPDGSVLLLRVRCRPHCAARDRPAHHRGPVRQSRAAAGARAGGGPGWGCKRGVLEQAGCAAVQAQASVPRLCHCSALHSRGAAAARPAASTGRAKGMRAAGARTRARADSGRSAAAWRELLPASLILLPSCVMMCACIC